MLNELKLIYMNMIQGQTIESEWRYYYDVIHLFIFGWKNKQINLPTADESSVCINIHPNTCSPRYIIFPKNLLQLLYAIKEKKTLWTDIYIQYTTTLYYTQICTSILHQYYRKMFISVKNQKKKFVLFSDILIAFIKYRNSLPKTIRMW